jgi:hypothetical protein
MRLVVPCTGLHASLTCIDDTIMHMDKRYGGVRSVSDALWCIHGRKSDVTIAFRL